jgi:hypothetical protein
VSRFADASLLSAQAQSIAVPGSTYGYDVLVRIGWLRYQARATYTEIHRELACQVRISESHIRNLYQHLYLPLLTCHERQHRDHLAQIAEAQGGLMIALDGLAPQGGEPQIWFIRELTPHRRWSGQSWAGHLGFVGRDKRLTLRLS